MAKTRDVFILIGSYAMSFAIGAFIRKLVREYNEIKIEEERFMYKNKIVKSGDEICVAIPVDEWIDFLRAIQSCRMSATGFVRAFVNSQETKYASCAHDIMDSEVKLSAFMSKYVGALSSDLTEVKKRKLLK